MAQRAYYPPPPPPPPHRTYSVGATGTISAIALLLLTLSLPQAAYPQQNTTNTEEDETVEEIVVTGSRLPVNPLNSPYPLSQISREDILNSGHTDLSDVLREIPGITNVSDISNSVGNTVNTGVNAVSLRGLASFRTLVLIDGRRTVSNSPSSDIVDIGSIPSDFIKRVDILTGAASSLYGSDAIAGVINYITEDDFEGLNITTHLGRAYRGGGGGEAFRGAFGRRFFDDRGYFLIAASGNWRDGLRATDRERALLELNYDYDCVDEDDIESLEADERLCINEFESLVGRSSADQPVNRYFGPDADLNFPQHLRDRSDFLPGGNFDFGRLFYDESGQRCAERNRRVRFQGQILQFVDCGATRSVDGFHVNRDGYSHRRGSMLTTPRERFGVSVKFDWNFTDSTFWSNSLMISSVDAESVLLPRSLAERSATLIVDPETGEDSIFTVGRMPRYLAGFTNFRSSSGTLQAAMEHPFVPFGARRLTSGTLTWRTRRFEVGSRTIVRESDTYRFASALRGDFTAFKRPWDWEVAMSYGRHELDNRRKNEVNLLKLYEGLRIEEDPDNPGSYRCANEDARQAGCAPVNLFGLSAMSPEAANYIRADLRLTSKVQRKVFTAYVATSELFKPFDATWGMVLGAETREDRQENRNDMLSQFGGTTGQTLPNSRISLDTHDLFAELDAPLLVNRPGAQLLALSLSARIGDYGLDHIDSTAVSTASIVWRPVDWLLLRTRYGEALRAPDLNEALGPLTFATGDVEDPCDGVTANSIGVIDDNCRSIPSILAAINDPSNSRNDDGAYDSSPSSYAPRIGNPNLRAETAETFTAGIVLTPSDWMSMQLDYYDVQIEDAISTYAISSTLDLCYSDPDNFFNQTEGVTTISAGASQHCQDVFRNETGSLVKVLRRPYNLNLRRGSGWDFGMNFRFPLDSIGLPGRMEIRGFVSRIKRQETRYADLDGEIVREQFIDESPKNDGHLRFIWRGNNTRLRWNVDYSGSFRDSWRRVNDYREQVRLATAEGLSPQQWPERPMFLWFDRRIEHDFSFTYVSRASQNLMLGWTGGINNVFDKSTPLYPIGDTRRGRLNNHGAPYGPSLGRWYYLRLEINRDFD